MNKRVLSFMVMIALFQFLKAESRPEAIEKIEVYYYSMTIYSGNSHPLYMNGISFCEFDLECSFHNIQEFAQSFYKHAYYIPDVCLGYEKMMIRGYVPFPSSYSKALCLQDSLSSHSIKKTINIEKEKVVVEYCQFTGIFWVGDQKVFGCLSADVAEVYHIRLKDKCYILKDILNFYDNIREGSGGVPVDTLKTTGYKRTALRTAKEQNRVTHVRAEQCRQVYQPHPINAVRVAKLSDESSVLGNFDEEEMAGQDIVLGGIDYGAKREAQEQVIAACYDSLQYVYQPVDRRSLVNVGMVPSGADTSDVDDSGEERGTVNPDTEWQRMYYYCTDHIGSTRLVLDDSARIAERLMFLPTGEVFMDEQNSTLYHPDFLFSGKELDAETGNYYFGARYLAPRLGIWLSPDPMQLKYPHVSSYSFCMGNPISRIDMHGDSIFYFMPQIQNGVIIGQTKYTYGKYGDTYGFGGENGELFIGSSKTISLFSEGLNRIRMGGSAGSELVSYLSGPTSFNVSLAYNGENMTEISLSHNGKNTLKVFWDPENQKGGIDAFGSVIRPPYIGLAHELAHAYDVIKNGYVDESLWFIGAGGERVLRNEIFACQMENAIRSENSLPLRKYYGGIGIIPSIQTRPNKHFNNSTFYYNK